ncbi:MAG: patatin-like phospholipase family protein [Gemmatimonadota bacterium]|nr:patatin-like phospholipase family protein [Gemmatimonadota bacterium]
MSGGGTRAAGFHLGMLSYLHRRGLLDNVIITTSASGGSIVNTTHALSQARGQGFEEYYAWLIRKLRSARMMEWVLEEFTLAKPHNLSGRRSMVVALADIYDRYFFDGARWGDLLDMIARAKPSHLEEVVVNATDFRTGLGFRFQLHDPVGNGATHIEPEQIRHARVADVMAASSCLPGGLEPFFFPEDFVWEGEGARANADSVKRTLELLNVESVPLMDGGIYDNQGLESLMLAVVRRQELGDAPGVHDGTDSASASDDTQRYANEFDLLFQQVSAGTVPHPPGAVIVSDAPQSALPVYRSGYGPGQAGRPLETLAYPRDSGIRVGRLKTYLIGFRVALASSLIAISIYAGFTLRELSQRFSSGWGQAAFYFLLACLIVAAATMGLAFLMLGDLRKNIRGGLGSVDSILDTEGLQQESREANDLKTWNLLKHLRVSELLYVMKLRMSSLVSLANDVFFIRTRVLSYMVAYLMPGWRDRLITNEIFDVVNSASREGLKVSDAMRNAVKDAESMPTAFWFDHPGDLGKLVISGQMNMCLNLIGYLHRKQERARKPLEGADQRLLDACLADWSLFLKNPREFLNEPPVIEGEGKLLTREEVNQLRARRFA